MRWWSSIRPFIASVGPLDAPPGVEVGQERVAPLFQGPAQTRDFGDRAGRQSLDEVLGQSPALGW